MKHRDLYLTLVALVILALVISLWPHKAHADPSTSVTVTQSTGYYGRRFVAQVDGPVSLIVLSAQTISSSGDCRTVNGSAGPHNSGYPIGADCSGPGSVIIDTVVYPACDQHVTVVADGDRIVFDQLIGSGNCAPPSTTTTTAPPSTTTTVPTTGTTARHCVLKNPKGGGCRKWSS